MNRKRWVIVTVVVVAAAVLSISLHMVLGNRPPIITGLEAEADRVFPGGSTWILCTASNRDGGELTYDWLASGGELDGEGATVTWTAPDEEGEYRIGVTVTDGRGGEAADHVTIRVKANEPPVINSLTADAEWTIPSGSIQITCDAEDSDGDKLSYEWSATGGNITGIGAAVTWIAPEEIGTYDITVVITDGHGGSATETLPHISVVTGQPPVIEGLEVTGDRHGHCSWIERRFGYDVKEGETYDIACIAFHPDGFELSYEWELDHDQVFEVSEDGSMITWTAPKKQVYITVTVTIYDVAGNMVSESIGVNVPCSPCTRWPSC